VGRRVLLIQRLVVVAVPILLWRRDVAVLEIVVIGWQWRRWLYRLAVVFRLLLFPAAHVRLSR
jgi:hypothetical protein